MSTNRTKLSDMEYFPLIRKWAKARKIITNKNGYTQKLKLYEEFGELCGGVLKLDQDLKIDSVGDMMVVLTNLAAINGVNIEDEVINMNKMDDSISERILLGWISFEMNSLIDSKSIKDETKAIKKIVIYLNGIAEMNDSSLEECIACAWNEIKDRKGKNVKGNFIKDK